MVIKFEKLVQEQKDLLGKIDELEHDDGEKEQLAWTRLAFGYISLEIERRNANDEQTPVADIEEKLGKVEKLDKLAKGKTDKDEFNKMKVEVIKDINGAVDKKMLELSDEDLDNLWP